MSPGKNQVPSQLGFSDMEGHLSHYTIFGLKSAGLSNPSHDCKTRKGKWTIPTIDLAMTCMV